jgi:hypothetical protein
MSPTATAARSPSRWAGPISGPPTPAATSPTVTFRSRRTSPGDWDLYNRIRSNGDELYAGRTQGDNNLRAICDAANAQNILVFAIGFEAPAGGQAVMRHCASSDAHYYDVDGIEISDAFASIARTINSLRLIQ